MDLAFYGFGPSEGGWEPEQLQLIGISLACPFSPRPLDAREFRVFCLNANTALLCKSRGTTMSNEIPDTITIRTRIISRTRKMSAICSFPGEFALHRSSKAIGPHREAYAGRSLCCVGSPQ